MRKPRLELYYPYPKGEVAAQRFRIEQYIPYLQKHFDIKIRSFWSIKTWKILYKKGYFFQKFFGLSTGYTKRILWLVPAMRADYIYILREATPIGPPFIEWILAKVMHKKIIYDFDDAIWLPNQSEVNRGMVKHLKYHSKVDKICSWAYKVSVGNNFLAEYASRFNNNVVIIPTTIDTENLHNPDIYPKTKNTLPIIGWTGTHSTLRQLDILRPVLDELIREIPFEFHIICDEFPKETRDYIRHIHWNKGSEIEDLLQFDIGVMPLYNNEWEKGKCGFKLLQYMALEIPSIASDVGVNSEIINHPDLGMLIYHNYPGEWNLAFRQLLSDSKLRKEMGMNARKRVIEKYSVLANKDKVLGLFLND
jgi:glycosyltransferase involved in cell wall biosynthesis